MNVRAKDIAINSGVLYILKKIYTEVVLVQVREAIRINHCLEKEIFIFHVKIVYCCSLRILQVADM